MEPLLRKSAFGLLRCPVCRYDLTPTDRSLVCEAGHHFDLAKSGYVNLRVGSGSLPAGGDRKRQLQRRDAFLAAGHFDFIWEAIARQVGPTACTTDAALLHILDAGCGTGYHLGKLAGHLRSRTGTRYGGLGFDLSKDAARIASRRLQHLAFAVADAWSDWPIRTRSVDLLVNVFAPKNFHEMARVLGPNGLLAMVYPGACHLVELRREFGLMSMRQGKTRSYVDAAQRFFGEVRLKRCRRHAALDRESVLNAILMGPNAAHVSETVIAARARTRAVTFDIHMLLAGRPRYDRSTTLSVR